MLNPAINDSEYDLIFKFTTNLWTKSGGASSGITKPEYGHDDRVALLKKAVAASALL